MKRVFSAALLWAVIIYPAVAAQVVWQGDLFIKEMHGEACVSGDFQTGQYASYFRAVFKPANLGDNGPNTKLSIVTPRSALQYQWNAASFGPATVTGTQIGGTANVVTSTATFLVANLSPAAPTEDTQTVVIRAKIQDFFGNAGCTVRLIGSLGNRPGL
jgi:hypothetical protein